MTKTSKRLPLRFYPHYIRAGNGRGRLRRWTITVFCALAVSFLSLCVDFGENFVAGQEERMNRISDREIFVVNATYGTERDQAIHNPLDSGFSDKLYRSIGMTLGVERVIPYFELDGMEIDGKAVPYYIVPYAPNQLMDQKSVRLDETVPAEDGVYLSTTLAGIIGLKEPGDSLSLKFQLPTKLKKPLGDGTNPFEEAVTVPVTRTLPVRGILNLSATNTCSERDDNVLYAPIATLQALLDTYRETPDETERAWAPSACWAVAYHYDEVTDVKAALRQLSPSVIARSRYQDIQAMTDSIRGTRQVMLVISVAIFLIVFMMITVLRIHETEQRKFEISILKANGLTRRETYRLILAESLWEAAKIFLCAAVFSVLLAGVINLLLFREALILLNGKLFAVLLGVSLLLMAAPAAATLCFTNRYEPDMILRN